VIQQTVLTNTLSCTDALSLLDKLFTIRSLASIIGLQHENQYRHLPGNL